MGLGRLLSTTCTRIISVFNSSPQQATLFLKNSLTTIIADAPGLSWDCHCRPPFARDCQSQKAGRSWAIRLEYRNTIRIRR